MTSLTWDRFHDAVLVRLEVIWEPGEVFIDLESSSGDARIKVTGLCKLEIPREEPWGHGGSFYVNRIKGFALPDGKHHRLEIETQSGDVVVLEAANFELCPNEGSP